VLEKIRTSAEGVCILSFCCMIPYLTLLKLFHFTISFYTLHVKNEEKKKKRNRKNGQ